MIRFICVSRRAQDCAYRPPCDSQKIKKEKHLLSPTPLLLERAPDGVPLLSRTLFVLYRVERARLGFPLDHIQESRLGRVKPHAIVYNLKTPAGFGRNQ